MSVPSPKRAFVLAAGYGTRMLPLTRDLPKPLMPLWGKPLLQHTLEMLARWGVRDVLINLHHKPGDILEFLRRNSDFGMRVALSYEPEILGTGGALVKASWFIGRDPFWLINADVAADLDPGLLLRSFRRDHSIAALWLHPARGPRTVEMRAGRITTFTSRRPGAANTFTFCGLHLLSPRILRHLPETGFAGIIGAYQRAMRRGERVSGVCVEDSYWADLGTPAQYLDAHRETRAAHPRKPGGRLFDPRACLTSKGEPWFVAAGQNCTIARGALVKDSVLWDGATVEAGAHAVRSVIGRGTRIAGRVEGVACRGDIGLEACEAAALGPLGIKASAATMLPLPPRGSARTFARIREGKHSVILVRYSLERKENALYCGHARFLAKAGLLVPAVLADQPAERFAVLEDLGSRSLTDAVRNARPGQVIRLYEKVLEQVLRLHETGTALARKTRLPLTHPFDAKLYKWERMFFADQFLRQRLRVGSRLRQDAIGELAVIARRLLREPQVLIHRDLQSSNILLADGGPALIDFQGMRMGSAAYDLASLLCDPYVALPEALQLRLLAFYNGRARRPVSEDAFLLAAVERLAQAMGAYARLSRIPGMKHFEQHIAEAARQQIRAASRSGCARTVEQLAHRALESGVKKSDHD